MNTKIDAYISGLKTWKAEIEALRRILLSCGLQEEFKWRQPCYTSQGKNLIILGCFKDSCAISFLNGNLLKDPAGILQRPGEHTQAGRVVRFRSLEDIMSLEATLKEYVTEAVDCIGSRHEAEKTEAPVIEASTELQDEFSKDPAFGKAFQALTPGRQKAYHMHFNASSNTETRIRRIGNYKQRILQGKGINDCVCGLSKRMPSCDGSHRNTAR